MKDLYEDNLSTFKEMFEDNNISYKMNDILLLGLGVPDNIIREMNLSQKTIFLKSLTDFQRDRGSVSFFQNVSKSFNDRFNIYELYVDKDEDEWVVKPNLIYQGLKINRFNTNFSYQEVYDKVPSLLIGISELEEIKYNNNASFPIKTNILLLDYDLYTEMEGLINLIIASMIAFHGNTQIAIYTTTEEFSLTLSDVLFFWYYILFKFHNVDIAEFQLKRILLFLNNKVVTKFPQGLVDLDALLIQLDSLETASDIADFYSLYIERDFLQNYRKDKIEVFDIEQIAVNINSDFTGYLINRLSGLSEIDEKIEVNLIQTEIFNSLKLFEVKASTDSYYDQYFLKYFAIFIDALPYILIDPKYTISYKLLYNFKPFHVELFTKFKKSVVSDSNLDRITPKSKYLSNFYLLITEIFECATDINHTEFLLNSSENIEMLEAFQKYFQFYFENKYTINEQTLLDLRIKETEVNEISDLKFIQLAIKVMYDLSLYNKAITYLRFREYNTIPLQDISLIKIKEENTDLESLSDLKFIRSFIEILYKLIINDNFENSFNLKKNISIDIEDSLSWIINNTAGDLLNLNENILTKLTFINNEEVVIKDTFEFGQ